MTGSTLLLLLSAPVESDGGFTPSLESLLLHSPADILRYLMIDLELGTLPEDEDTWPIFCSSQPNLPDDHVTSIDTQGRENGRIMFSGEYEEYHGVQVRVQAKNHSTGYAKLRRIALTLDQGVRNKYVSISPALYLIDSVHRTSLIVADGKDVPKSKRSLFTLNVLVRLSRSL
jgi:hypothetical protein